MRKMNVCADHTDKSVMSSRVSAGCFFIRLGSFIQSLAPAVMRPDDLIQFSRQTYSRNVESWGRDDLADSGLSPEEAAVLKTIPLTAGKLLLLGVGGGREAIPLARAGFEVTGVDFVPEMVETAKRNAESRGVRIEGLVQEISRLELPPSSCDVAWLSAAMYSCVPTRKRRIEMLKRISQALRPGGYFACQFHWTPNARTSPLTELIRQGVAYLSLGNPAYEKGDMLWYNIEFIHAFSSEDDLRSEFRQGGFEVIDLSISERMPRGWAVLRKQP